jgi:SAM-dependent methyltransferase
MALEGDLETARKRFFEERFPNLDHLLAQRYDWMNEWIDDSKNVLEIGAGAGFSELYLKTKPWITDTVLNPWVDELVDALSINRPDQSIDVIIASHTIHHFASPALFFEECARILRPGGVVLIQEINTSLLMRFLLRVMRHEGYSYDVDVFNKSTIANDPRDPWSANCAIPEMLFSDTGHFEKRFDLNVKLNSLNECLLFPLSGGVIAKTKVPRLPRRLLKFISLIDKALVLIAPRIFALGRSVVIQRA